jgi:hypothetical protein
MRCLVITLAVLLAGALPARAADYVTERGHLICTSLPSLRDAREAVSNRDRNWLESIKECSQSEGGLKAELLQEGVLTTKIKIYQDNGQSVIYWTAPDTLKEIRR